jgi:hypothetical protein
VSLYARKATASDFYTVFSDLSDISAAEFCGRERTWWAAMRYALDLHKLYAADVILDGDTPIAIVGHNKDAQEKHTRVTWFAGRPQFFASARATRWLRRYIAGVVARWPATWFDSYSSSPHPAAARWFSLLGFEQVQAYAAWKKYRLSPRAVECDKTGVFC